MKFKKLPELKRLFEMFTIDSDKGELSWKIRKANRIQVGDLAGNLKKEGNTFYRVVMIDGIKYKTHRIIYKMHNPQWNENDIIDHIKHNEIDINRIENLQIVTHQQNQFKKVLKKKGTSIHKGVSWNKQMKKWKASIMIDGKSIYLGLYSDELEAAKAYKAKAKELFGDFYE